MRFPSHSVSQVFCTPFPTKHGVDGSLVGWGDLRLPLQGNYNTDVRHVWEGTQWLSGLAASFLFDELLGQVHVSVGEVFVLLVQKKLLQWLNYWGQLSRRVVLNHTDHQSPIHTLRNGM